MKKPLLVQKQTTPQQKALDLSFNLTPWKWAWHYQEGATPIWRKKHFLLIFYRRVDVFWLFGFNDIYRKPLLGYSHFQGVKLKLRSRAFRWGIVCFCASNGSFRILILENVSFGLLHPVLFLCFIYIILQNRIEHRKNDFYNVLIVGAFACLV